jgi:NAD(P)H-hydrate epimerase
VVSGEPVSWLLNWREVAVLDANAEALGVNVSDLMAAAGKALAHKAATMAPKGEILILCGPGNNGGDGFVAALELLELGGKVRVIASHNSQKGEVAQAFRTKCPSVEVWKEGCEFGTPVLLIDCLLGVGLKGAPRGKIAKMIDWVKPNNPALVLACDIPSGLGSKRFLAADATVTFHAEKQEMMYADVGEITVVPLPWPPETVNCGPGDALCYPPLDPSAHKGERGRVLIVGGGPYHGAPILAGRAAARIGCDLIHVAMPRNAVDRATWPDHLIPERLFDEDNLGERGRDEIFKLLEEKSFDAVLIGPGLGRLEETTDMAREIIAKLAELDIPTVIDADAIYALDEGVWPKGLSGVATPHARELRMWIWDGKPNKILADEDVSSESRVIIRTGAVDQLTGLEGRYCECTGGHPRMATGGTGDLLAGAVAGLLAQGMTPWSASRLACYVMRVAGMMTANEFGPGLLASDVPPHIARALAKLTAD